MRHLQKTVSLESFKSRIPGVLKALDCHWFLDNAGITIEYPKYADAYNDTVNSSMDSSQIYRIFNFYGFSDKKILSSDTNGNYGKLISDIEIPSKFCDKITDYTDIYINIPKDKSNPYDFYSIEQISDKDIKNRFWNDDKYYFYNEGNIWSVDTSQFSGTSNITKSMVLSSNNVTQHKYLTYYTLKKWLKFFDNYNKLLHSGNRLNAYKSAIDYYNSEIYDKTPSLEEEYENYDDIFNSRGGFEFYEWVTNNCAPRFYISCLNESGDAKLSNVDTYWGCSYLNCPDALKWLGWFNVRYKLYSGLTSSSQCKNKDNCCDCAEYINRGGNKMHDRLNAWAKSLTIEDASLSSASINIPLMLTNNISDLGQMSMLSSEFNQYENYLSQLKYSQVLQNFSGGTVIKRPIITDESTGNIFISDNTYMIKNSRSGVRQNNYLENVFDPTQWVNYTSYYMQKYPDEFVTQAKTYSYKTDGSIVFNPTSKTMAEPYDMHLSKNGYVLYNNQLHEIEYSKYVIYSGNSNSLLNGKMFKVNESTENMYYTNISDRLFYTIKKNGNYYFNFKSRQTCSNNVDYDCMALPSGDLKVKSVTLDNVFYLVSNGYVIIDDAGMLYRCPVLNGYVDINGVRYYIKNQKLVQFDDFEYVNENDFSGATAVFEPVTEDENRNKISYFIQKDKIYITHPYQVYRCDVISGRTDSKLSLLKSTNILTDDLGNEMPGYFEPTVDFRLGSKYIQPYYNYQLDLYYKVGNVSQLSMNDFLTIDDDINNQFFDGNILQTMNIFYTVNGYVCKDSIVTLDNDSSDSSKTDVISAINESTKKVNKYISSTTVYDDTIKFDSSENSLHLYCEFIYFMGSILKQKYVENSGGTYSYDGYKLVNGYHKGIKYRDICELTLEKCTYQTAEGINIPMKYYAITKPTRNIILNSYDDQVYNVDDAAFSMEICLLRKDKDGNIMVSDDEFTQKKGFDQTNNIVASPMFRHEYNLGTTFQETSNSDIYIDRGINKALDKHIRLQEIKTIDALLQYQNGDIFNVIEN